MRGYYLGTLEKGQLNNAMNRLNLKSNEIEMNYSKGLNKVAKVTFAQT